MPIFSCPPIRIPHDLSTFFLVRSLADRRSLLLARSLSLAYIFAHCGQTFLRTHANRQSPVLAISPYLFGPLYCYCFVRARCARFVFVFTIVNWLSSGPKNTWITSGQQYESENRMRATRGDDERVTDTKFLILLGSTTIFNDASFCEFQEEFRHCSQNKQNCSHIHPIFPCKCARFSRTARSLATHTSPTYTQFNSRLSSLIDFPHIN